jgi:hypothetical protein
VSRFAAGRFAAISDSAVSSGASALEEDEKNSIGSQRGWLILNLAGKKVIVARSQHLRV